MSGDPVQLQQVLLNLLLNAMDAMNETVPSRRIIIIGTQAGRGELAVNVSDRGVGLTQPHQEGATDIALHPLHAQSQCPED